MEYTKPELKRFGQATEVIRDFSKTPAQTIEFIDPNSRSQVNPAYDLDQ